MKIVTRESPEESFRGLVVSGSLVDTWVDAPVSGWIVQLTCAFLDPGSALWEGACAIVSSLFWSRRTKRWTPSFTSLSSEPLLEFLEMQKHLLQMAWLWVYRLSLLKLSDRFSHPNNLYKAMHFFASFLLSPPTPKCLHWTVKWRNPFLQGAMAQPSTGGLRLEHVTQDSWELFSFLFFFLVSFWFHSKSETPL